MRLKNIKIEKLHEFYRYDISFNQDITFLYGEHGVGKTTVLDILVSILKGELYELFKYDFKSIDLEYYDETEARLSIEKHRDEALKEEREDFFNFFRKTYDQNKTYMEVKFKGESYIISEAEIKSAYSRYEGYYLKIKLFEIYPLFNEIAESFDYFYLPFDNRSFKTNHLHKKDMGNFDDGNLLKLTSDLIDREVNTINKKEKEMMNDFRDRLLKGLVEINEDIFFEKNLDLESYLSLVEKRDEEIYSMSESYYNILRKFSIENEADKRPVDYFKRIVSLREEIALDDGENNWKLAMLYRDLRTIEKLIELFNDMEEELKKSRQRMELYLLTINKFLSNSSERKEALIKNNKLFFYMEDTDSYLGVKNLSSGERQIVIFFAYMIFNGDKRKNPIFIVDEPELSLSKAWQKIFVKSLVDISKDIQLILATHSEDIIGEDRSKLHQIKKEIDLD